MTLGGNVTAIPALIALAGVILGAVLGHLLAVRSQRLAWNREDARRLQTRENAERINFSVEVVFCQWPISSPRRRPVVVPAGGHGFLPAGGQISSPPRVVLG